MEAKEMTVSDLAREQIRNAERLFPLILEKQKKEKRKNNHIGIRRFWCR